ncbi:MAG: TRAP transporter substrate-binding protein [Pseudomonadota bacterium]
MKHGRLYRVLAMGLLALGAGPAFAQDVTLKVHHFVGPNATAHTQLLTPWCAKVGKESSGKIKCQIYPAMQLGGTPPQLFDQARDGVADIVWTVPTYQAGRFTKSEVFELPHMTRTAEGGSRAFWEYVQKNALDEFKGVKVLMLHVHDGSLLHFAGKSVKTLEDVKGLKVRSPTRIGVKWLAAIGAVPVQMPVPQVPESIAKGVVDGASLPWEIVPALKVNEIAKTHTEMPKGYPHMSNTIFVVAMNQAKYDGLPADLKKVIDANSGPETSAWAGKVWDGTAAPGRKSATDRGNTVNVLSPDEARRWEMATAGVVDEWKKEVAAKGGDGAALYAAARKLLMQHDNK